MFGSLFGNNVIDCGWIGKIDVFYCGVINKCIYYIGCVCVVVGNNINSVIGEVSFSISFDNEIMCVRI